MDCNEKYHAWIGECLTAFYLFIYLFVYYSNTLTSGKKKTERERKKIVSPTDTILLI
jgi:hypothetical protein